LETKKLTVKFMSIFLTSPLVQDVPQTHENIIFQIH